MRWSARADRGGALGSGPCGFISRLALGGVGGGSSRRRIEGGPGRAGGGRLCSRLVRGMVVAVLRLSVQGCGGGPSAGYSLPSSCVASVVVLVVLVCVLVFVVWWWSSFRVALCSLSFGALSPCCPLPLSLELIFGFFFPAELLLFT